MFVNHSNAKKMFHTIIKKELPNWIVISGGEKSGKSSFTKEVCSNKTTLFCDPKWNLSYLEGIIRSLKEEPENLLKDFLCYIDHKFESVKKNFENICYIDDITYQQFSDVIRFLINEDIFEKKYEYARYLGNIIGKRYNYLVLDNFYKCDAKSYEWILQTTENFQKNGGYVIVICDFEKMWTSKQVYDIFAQVPSLIDINTFDKAEDYFDVLKNHIYFDNVYHLHQTAEILFKVYHGSSQLLFKTIQMFRQDKSDDDLDKQKQLLNISKNFNTNHKQTFNNTDKLILNLLAISPVPLNIEEIANAIELTEDLVKEVVVKHYNNNLLEMEVISDRLRIYYTFSDTFLKKSILSNIEKKELFFYYNRLYTMKKMGKIQLASKDALEIAILLKNPESERLLIKLIDTDSVTDEEIAKYLDKFYSQKLHLKSFISLKMAKILYHYGYYSAALYILESLKNVNICISKKYEYLMLLGDVQHLLLLKEASKTFEEASKISEISVNQKLSAINRQIMSLNQSDYNDTIKAKNMYNFYLQNYSNCKCDGLIELYRNSNNSYPYEQALEYTIKGYLLAVELGNELEEYKCIHNICMLKLHQNNYNQPLKRKEICFEPTFDMVYDFFSQHSQYIHEQAYPLLDMGTVEMFSFVQIGEEKNLVAAKDYYSKAQLLAKSYYAKNIAKMGLLIVNTYLYGKDPDFKEILKWKREEIFKKYKEEKIVDYRVNRKILLSLAVSAIIVHSIDESIVYLKQVKKYMIGPEINRYNNLCELAEIHSEKLKFKKIEEKQILYYTSPKFVPWLISLAH